MWEEKAKELATKLHAGQYRRDGVTPYIVHPAAVAAACNSDLEKAVAWLHDTIEESLEARCDILTFFPVEIYLAVMTLTRCKYHTYTSYIKRVAANPLARAVKIADIRHNLSDAPTCKQREKYAKALKILVPEKQ